MADFELGAPVFAKTAYNVDVASECYETCRPNDAAEYVTSRAVADYTMQTCFEPSLAKSVVIETEITCPGGKRKFLRGFQCPMEAVCSIQAVSE